MAAAPEEEGAAAAHGGHEHGGQLPDRSITDHRRTIPSSERVPGYRLSIPARHQPAVGSRSNPPPSTAISRRAPGGRSSASLPSHTGSSVPSGPAEQSRPAPAGRWEARPGDRVPRGDQVPGGLSPRARGRIPHHPAATGYERAPPRPAGPLPGTSGPAQHQLSVTAEHQRSCPAPAASYRRAPGFPASTSGTFPKEPAAEHPAACPRPTPPTNIGGQSHRARNQLHRALGRPHRALVDLSPAQPAAEHLAGLLGEPGPEHPGRAARRTRHRSLAPSTSPVRTSGQLRPPPADGRSHRPAINRQGAAAVHRWQTPPGHLPQKPRDNLPQ